MKNRTYAQDTKVPADRTRSEIEALLARYKARATAVFQDQQGAAIAFEINERRILFRIKLLDPKTTKADAHRRATWRALLLSIKAKMISVDTGIETFEEAFMAHVVMPDGQTVGDTITPRIAEAYREQKMIPLLPRLPKT